MTSATFSGLPPEIRYDIWQLSFEPRLLCLHMHRLITPEPSDHSPSGLSKDSRKVIAVSFTCTALDSRSERTPNDVFVEYSNISPPVSVDFLRNMQVGPPGPTALGPVQLYVCRESRALAMRRYELAFGGTEQDNENLNPRQYAALEEWHRKKLWEKKIWVDFNSDVVLVEVIPRRLEFPAPPLRLPQPQPGWRALRCLNVYAPDEAKKIKRLAIGGKWPLESDLWRELGLIICLNTLLTSHTMSIEFFTNMEKLLVDDSFQNPEDVQEQVQTEEQDKLEDPKMVEEGVQKWIRDLVDCQQRRLRTDLGPERVITRPDKPVWKELPVVKVVHGNGWKRLLQNSNPEQLQ
ncbi:uncharacterized protein LY89DRAFT_718676 [Mollisia scopiformis]|uniref:2EXR domain-containing protein n=1 Tax=Mollisia scopiformis TaxID=149040 RepID=A0A194X9W7_MOLSC|nr:uncharacterized protein LY89DRAFT_718676 [Mollisia scopiformis]KUJ16966.1 hypothetical protein LY89DRAFT_718676 [Mollisia scopiformis]